MATQKAIAQFLRLALRFRLADTGAIERWVDSVIAAQPVVRFPFTDLAGSSKLRPETVDELLGQVTGTADDFLPGHLLLGLLRRRLLEGDLAPETAIKLVLEAGRSGALTEKENYKADHLDDSVWLATNDTYGTLDEVRRDIAEFFERYAVYDEQIPTVV